MRTKTRNSEYLTVLVNNFGEDILNTAEVYELIKKVDAEFGFNCPDNLLSSVLSRICENLDGAITSMDDTDTKRRGRSNPKLYFIDTQKALARIEELKAGTASKPAAKPVKKVCAKVEVKRRGKEPLTLCNVLEQLYHQLEIAYDTNGLVINLTPTRIKILLDNHINNVIYADWTQKNRNILNLKSQGDIRNSMISLDGYMKEKFNMEFGACTKFNVVRVSTRDANQELSVDEEKYVLYIIMKAIQHDRRPVDISSLLKILREQLGVTMDRHGFIDLVKSVRGLTFSQDKTTVMFDTNIDPEQVLQDYNPENFKEKVYARIGMSAEEVIKYFPASSLVSKISENDGIYELLVDRSFKSREMLLKLYRTFRGTDMIIGSEQIVNYLNLQLAKADGLYKRDSFLYKLETA